VVSGCHAEATPVRMFRRLTMIRMAAEKITAADTMPFPRGRGRMMYP